MPDTPGRPPIGPVVNVRLPQELIDKLDKMRGDLGRAAAIRIILDDAVNGYASKHLLERLRNWK